MKNRHGKTRTQEHPYEIWQNKTDPRWTWRVLKKYQTQPAEEQNRFARWFCFVTSPYVPDGELGDVYVLDITMDAVQVFSDDSPR